MNRGTVVLSRRDGTTSTEMHSHWFAKRFIEPVRLATVSLTARLTMPVVHGIGRRVYARTEWIRNEAGDVIGAVFVEEASA